MGGKFWGAAEAEGGGELPGVSPAEGGCGETPCPSARLPPFFLIFIRAFLLATSRPSASFHFFLVLCFFLPEFGSISSRGAALSAAIVCGSSRGGTAPPRAPGVRRGRARPGTSAPCTRPCVHTHGYARRSRSPGLAPSLPPLPLYSNH